MPKCSQRGCPFPPVARTGKMAGLCRNHAGLAEEVESKEDREHVIDLRETGRDGLRLSVPDGATLASGLFGMKVPYSKLQSFGKLVAAGWSVDDAARSAAIAPSTGYTFLRRSGFLDIVKSKREIESRASADWAAAGTHAGLRVGMTGWRKIYRKLLRNNGCRRCEKCREWSRAIPGQMYIHGNSAHHVWCWRKTSKVFDAEELDRVCQILREEKAPKEDSE